jgi:hypothetical protein
MVSTSIITVRQLRKESLSKRLIQYDISATCDETMDDLTQEAVILTDRKTGREAMGRDEHIYNS